MARPIGWRNDPARHSLAAKGIRTGGAVPVAHSLQSQVKQVQKINVIRDDPTHWGVIILFSDGSRKEVWHEKKSYDEKHSDLVDEFVHVSQGYDEYEACDMVRIFWPDNRLDTYWANGEFTEGEL